MRDTKYTLSLFGDGGCITPCTTSSPLSLDRGMGCPPPSPSTTNPSFIIVNVIAMRETLEEGAALATLTTHHFATILKDCIVNESVYRGERGTPRYRHPSYRGPPLSPPLPSGVGYVYVYVYVYGR